MVAATVYYAHPISTYGSEQEKSDLSFIESMADKDLEIKIVNPASTDIQKEFSEWKKNGKKEDDHEMRFFKSVISKCSGLVFRGNTSGVRYEVAKAKEFDLPVLEIK